MQCGVLKQWKKDFGFIEVASGERYFVHISVLKRGGIRQARLGSTLYFTLGKDQEGRSRAVTAALDPAQLAAKQERKIIKRPVKSKSRYDWIDYLVLILLPVALLLGLISPLGGSLLAAVGLLSVATYLLYALDKHRANQGTWRIPESTLHALATLGGWPGAWLAQQQFRHKTQKAVFRFGFVISIVLNVAVLGYLVLLS